MSKPTKSVHFWTVAGCLLLTAGSSGLLAFAREGQGLESQPARSQAGPETVEPSLSMESVCNDADLIFEGMVTDVSFRNSDLLTAEDQSLPHTFVTFRVDHILKGEVERGSRELTLRFLGGPDGQGNMLRSSISPVFQVGDQEVLMVKNNGTRGIPLVYSQARRFRVLGDQVLNEEGREVLLTDEGRMTYGKRDPKEAFRQVMLGNQPVSRGGEIENLDQVFEGTRMNRLSLRTFLTSVILRASVAPRIETAPVVSIDIAQPFSMKASLPEAPPSDFEVPALSDKSESDKLEREALERNGGSPVIK